MASRRLLVIPWAGGGVSAFRKWSSALPYDVELWGAALPGHEGRLAEAPFRHIFQVVEPLSRTIAEWPLGCVLFGHSLGAWMAYETARRLQALGVSARGLVVSGMPAPHAARAPSTRIAALPDDQFLAHMDERYGGLSPGLRGAPELLSTFMPVLRADMEMLESYRYEPGPALSIPIEAWVGTDDPLTEDPESVQRWNDLAAAPVRLTTFSGAHFFLQGQEAQVAEALERICNEWG